MPVVIFLASEDAVSRVFGGVVRVKNGESSPAGIFFLKTMDRAGFVCYKYTALPSRPANKKNQPVTGGGK